MSVLNRYRKPGGFRQLVQLIETSQPVKQAQLLKAVAHEDPNWAQLLMQKKITIDMVLAWDKSLVWIIFEAMQDRHCATLLCHLGHDWTNQVPQNLHQEKARQIRRLLLGMGDPSPAEIRAAQVHLLEVVRLLDEEKRINLRLIDPRLDLEDAA